MSKLEWIEFEKKLNRWHEFIKNDPWLRTYGTPFLYKMLWKVKVQARPVYFVNPFWLAFNFSVLITFVMILPTNNLCSKSVCLYVGIAVGVFITLFIRVVAVSRKLPRWEDL